jgi:hypothetical protein
LSSLELHLKYLSLDDDSYAKIQPWPKHQRPNRWILDLAKQRALALKAQVEERVKMGDVKFSDSLEAMSFLANLVGSQHIERFIPMAESAPAAPSSAASPTASGELATIAMPITLPGEAAATAVTGTREMPQFVATKTRKPPPPGNAHVARAERKASRATTTAGSNAARDQVIADAERLLQWGRKWYELAELIARMADRPSLPEVRRILKEHKATLDKKRDDG